MAISTNDIWEQTPWGEARDRQRQERIEQMTQNQTRVTRAPLVPIVEDPFGERVEDDRFRRLAGALNNVLDIPIDPLTYEDLRRTQEQLARTGDITTRTTVNENGDIIVEEILDEMIRTPGEYERRSLKEAMHQSYTQRPKTKSFIENIKDLLSDYPHVLDFIVKQGKIHNLSKTYIIKTMIIEAHKMETTTGNPMIDKINAELYQLEREKDATDLQTNRNQQRTPENGGSEEREIPF